jgi:hypothetical protein
MKETLFIDSKPERGTTIDARAYKFKSRFHARKVAKGFRNRRAEGLVDSSQSGGWPQRGWQLLWHGIQLSRVSLRTSVLP